MLGVPPATCIIEEEYTFAGARKPDTKLAFWG